MAQLAEQLICNQQVIGSSPIIGFIYGWFPEWPKGTDCKSAGNAFGGSNPPPLIFLMRRSFPDPKRKEYAWAPLQKKGKVPGVYSSNARSSFTRLAYLHAILKSE